MSERIADTVLEYRGPLGQQSRCRLRVYLLGEQTLVAICTELVDNPGRSVTNAAEVLAALIRRVYGRPGQALLIFEHYQAGRYGGDNDLETFDRVLPTGWDGIRYQDMSWRPSSRAEVEQLLNYPLDDE